MSFDQYQQPGQQPQYVAPMSLPYSGPIAPVPVQPGRTLATVIGVIGIVVASLTLLFVLFKGFSLGVTATFGRRLPWGAISQASIVVQAFDALASLVLGIVLLIGSIGLLRLRRWSRRLLNAWALVYLAVLVLFLVLELKIVVPNQVAMVNKMFTNMPGMMNANGGVNATFTTTGSGGTTVTTWSTTMPTTAAGTGNSVAVTANAASTPFGAPLRVQTKNVNVANPFATPQMASMMGWTYSLMAFVKAFLCAIFPIIILITLQLSRMRSIFHSAGEGSGMQTPR
jgi:hypothetical protein